MTLIFAHRGSAGTHPENTMSAFKEAARVGADGIETDVQLSKDGEVVIIHDEKLNRTTNASGFVKDRTLMELKTFNASNSYKGKMGNERIPTLEELLIWLKNNQLLCIIELKNTLFLYPGLEEKVIRLIRSYEMEERIIISSFNHYSLVNCHQLAPEIETAPLYRDGLFMPWIYAKAIGGSAIHPNIRVAPDIIIQSSMCAGVPVRPYTINKESDMKRLYSLRCSAIITDFPGIAKRVREEFE
ncbi:glycerophosphodiester phosphodiesterase [Peribacillus butanolivorans]|uniref:glycerophosphodiester phosphodiesterase n=1 Tax=Peribacillus butanolivorans TaxID=421767 RepID=UPI00207C2D6F|nr:glycerophosphodiester phosphodiesterase [Peribacillus butanolivorans]MCO0596448.1 glycerophosphodiester phosphodiesterase [Peribacillus butanolivorans]